MQQQRMHDAMVIVHVRKEVKQRINFTVYREGITFFVLRR